MTVAASRNIDNLKDTNRKVPSTVLSPRVLTSLEGIVAEKITGPAGDAVVKLSKPAIAIVAVLSYITASGNLVATEGAPNVVDAFKLEGTHFSVNLNDSTGVAALTELLSADNSTNTWLVLYQPEEADETIGGQTTVTP